MTVEREKRREKEHIQALAHCRKACEGSSIASFPTPTNFFSFTVESQRHIESLGPSYDHA